MAEEIRRNICKNNGGASVKLLHFITTSTVYFFV
jgi:hypothetical protein